MKKLIIAISLPFILCAAPYLLAQAAPSSQTNSSGALSDLKVIPVWPGTPPGLQQQTGAKEREFSSRNGMKYVQNVTRPTLTAFVPAKSNGTAVVICPGGAYHFLAIDYEGNDVARWLSSFGVTAFVLKYRLYPTGDNPLDETHQAMQNAYEIHRRLATVVPLADADGEQAVRLVRQHAAEWGLQPNHIVLMGFSAGGGVTVDVALHHTPDSRPDFVAPIYPVVIENFEVPPDAPPLFTAAAADDPLLKPAKHCVRLYSAWNEAGKPAEMHIYSKGGHGFGLNTQHLPVDSWKDRFFDWIVAQQLASRQ